MSLPIQTAHRWKGRSGEKEFCVHRALLPSSYMSGGHAARPLRRNEHGYEQQTEGKCGELTHAHRFCKRLLRRPCTGRHQRVLRGGCGSQVDWRHQLWLWVSASKRRADEVGLLRLVVLTAKVALNAQANAMSPDLAGVSSITTGSLSGSARLMFKAGNTISVPHVLWVAALLR